MALEIVAISFVGIGVVITGAGMVRLWIKNGTEAAKRDGALNTELKNLVTGQELIHQRVSDIRDNMNTQVTHCASVTSGFSERIKDLERRV